MAHSRVGGSLVTKFYLLRHAMAHRVRQYAPSIDLAHPRLVAV